MCPGATTVTPDPVSYGFDEASSLPSVIDSGVNQNCDFPQWLDNFLSRVVKPTYFRSNSTKEIYQDFAKARLKDELNRVNGDIVNLENRRKHIFVIEIIESTVKNKHIQALRRFKIILPRSLACKKSLQRPLKDGGRNNELDSKMLMLENERQLHALGKLRSKIKAGIVVRRRLFSAVYRMPPNIWAQIFVWCLPDDDEYVKPDKATAPLLLCRVCYAWRSAAIHTPALWRSLVVLLQEQTTRKASLKTWIDRAGVLPLSLHILWGPTQSLHIHDRVFDYLLSLAGRWMSVKLSSAKTPGTVWQTYAFPTRVYKLLSYPMPVLRTLELEPALTLGLTSLERNAPNLRALWLMNSAFDPMPLIAVSAGSWRQLASFRSRHPLDTRHAVRILKLCPNLVECEVSLISCSAAELRGALVRMPVLEGLTINETTAGILDAFLHVLEVPELKELTLSAFRDGAGESPWNATAIISLVNRTAKTTTEGAKLSTLRMTGLNCDDKAIAGLVSGIPTLFWFDIKHREKELWGHNWVKTLRGGGCRGSAGSFSGHVCSQGNLRW
ncbi:hypothetical protein GALMADRAFT_248312 [Galerina marginata CBS 339.88]|uniref:Uncharacterized protein n=1 Tax=Galerina marginata (strain CBS 339.88) TaxID=685588 RepID=A0A067T9L2_GALM3|nr:hypothetical protein GALMADRAFT_248312 [Galerina marginata CBS 339.88]